MRKSLKIGLAILPAVVALAGFAACDKGGDKDKGHEHTYNTTWSTSATHHWHAANCAHTGEVKDRATHVYSEDWSFDDESHWRECTVCERKTNEAIHNFVDGVCGDCGYVDAASKLIYTLSGNTYTVTVDKSALEDKGFTKLTIPEQHNGKKVRTIGENAFNGAKYLEEVTIPKTVWYIEDYAFQDCTSLKGITLPVALMELGNQVFAGCTSLAGTVTIPTMIETIGENLFLGCEKLQGVELPQDLTRIGTQAFANCASLTSVTIPNKVTYIGMKAFKGTGLQEVTVPESVTTLYSYAFQDCTSLKSAEILASLEYITGSWFNGCTALETLTLPFVGQDIHPLPVNRTALGYAFGTVKYGTEATVAAVEQFEQSEDKATNEAQTVTYYIPKSLKSVTVLGGIIKEGAFDNCAMLETVTLKENVEAEADTFKNCTAEFIVAFEITVKGVKFTKADEAVTEAYVGDELNLTYNASKFSEISVIVKKDGEAAAASDYEYDKENNTIVFKSEGTFVATVTAVNGEQNVSASAMVEITFAPPALSEITLSSASENLSDGSASTTISYTVDDESVVTVVVKKGGTALEGVYDEETKTVTVTASGAYTIEVKAVRNGKTVTKTAVFTVSNPDAVKPEISFGSETVSVVEGNAAAIAPTVTYPAGATKNEEVYTFFALNDGNYENADTNDYVWNETTKEFTPKIAGTYQIKLTALTVEGGEQSETLTVTATADKNITLALADSVTKTNGWVRALTGTDKEVAYTVDGYAYGYSVTYDKDIDGASISGLSGQKVTLSLASANTVNFKVIYTHKKDATAKVELVIPVSFVTDENAPVLGADPFDDAAATLIPSMGVQLYYDVTSGGTQVDKSNVTYSIVGSDLKFGDESVMTDRAHINEILGRKYLIVENYADDKEDGATLGNTAHGTVTVKLAVTVDGKTAAATKVFTVEAVATKKTNTGLNDYLKKYFDIKNTDYEAVMSLANRQNSVVTKEGILFNRAWGSGDHFRVNVGKIDNFQLDFTYEALGRTDNDKVSFAVKFTTYGYKSVLGQKVYSSSENGSQTAFYAENGAEDIRAFSWGGYDNDSQVETTKPLVESGKIHIRLTHTLSGSTNTFSWQWSLNGTDYTDWYKYTAASSTTPGNMGAQVDTIKFYYEAGRYLLGPVTVTNL